MTVPASRSLITLEAIELGRGKRAEVLAYRSWFFVLYGDAAARRKSWQAMGPYETQDQARARVQSLQEIYS